MKNKSQLESLLKLIVRILIEIGVIFVLSRVTEVTVIKALIVIFTLNTVFVLMNGASRKDEINQFVDNEETLQNIPKGSIVLFAVLSLSGLTSVAFGAVYLLLKVLIDSDIIYIINSSIILAELIVYVPRIIGSIFNEKDESDLGIFIEIVDRVLNKFKKALSIKGNNIPGSVYGGMSGGMGMMGCGLHEDREIFIKLNEIKGLLTRIKDLANKSSVQDRESIKNQLEFILEDFENIYDRYGARQIVTNQTVFSKYSEYLKYVTDGIKDLEKKILDNKLDTLDSAVAKLKSFSELNNLEEKYK